MVKSIRLKNFKSFRKVEIPFAPGFTAVAGANASGKSNVIDALLFAMGITSLRLLRASKLTELVNHDATDGYAKVELTITDKGGRDITITRMVDRQGKSVCRLDGKRKTLSEVQSLLLELGVNPNGHNIVVQGDITRVIEMNAKQRRQIIEEVAGLQEFEEKKDEAIKKLGKVEQKVKDAHLILNERESYLQQLETERENALRYNALHEEMKRSKATILSEEIRIIRREMDKARQGLERMQKEIVDRRTERNRLQDEERELENRAEEATKKLIEAGEKMYSSLGRDAEQKKGHMNLLDERLRSRREALEVKEKRIAQIGQELAQTKERLSEKELELEDARASLQQAEGELEEITRSMDSKKPGSGERKGGLRRLEEKLSEVLAEISGAREELHRANLEKHGLEKEAKASEHSIKELLARKDRIDERAKEKEELEKKLVKLGKRSPAERLAGKEKEFGEVLARLHSAKGRLESLEESMAALSKAKTECPTCDQPIAKQKKEKLASARAEEAGELRKKISGFESEARAIVSERKSLQEDEKEHSRIVIGLGKFDGLDDEAAEINKKISALQENPHGKKISALSKREDELAKSISALEKQRLEAEEKIRELRESGVGAGIEELLGRLQEINDRKSEKENEATRLGAEIEHSLKGGIAHLDAEAESAQAEAQAAKKAIAELGKEKESGHEELERIEAELEKANRANRLLEEEKNRLTAKIGKMAQKREELSLKIEAAEKEVNEFNIEQSRNDVRVVDLEEESRDYGGVEPFGEFALNELKKRIPEIEKEVEKLGAINMKSLENFDSFKKEVEDVRTKANKLDEERVAVVEMIQKIEVRKLGVFMECFSHVGAKFSELYFKFFEGEGLLELSDKISPLEGGLLIQAKYRGDTLKSIDAMSGGEKSLTALAFLFAIQSFEPAPFYIFDEVDAALDKENSIKVGRMIKEQSGKSQFISISHNDAVINQADQIIGVALNRQKSSVIGLRLRKGQNAPLEPAGGAGNDNEGQEEEPKAEPADAGEEQGG